MKRKPSGSPRSPHTPRGVPCYLDDPDDPTIGLAEALAALSLRSSQSASHSQEAQGPSSSGLAGFRGFRRGAELVAVSHQAPHRIFVDDPILRRTSGGQPPRLKLKLKVTVKVVHIVVTLATVKVKVVSLLRSLAPSLTASTAEAWTPISLSWSSRQISTLCVVQAMLLNTC